MVVETDGFADRELINFCLAKYLHDSTKTTTNSPICESPIDELPDGRFQIDAFKTDKKRRNSIEFAEALSYRFVKSSAPQTAPPLARANQNSVDVAQNDQGLLHNSFIE